MDDFQISRKIKPRTDEPTPDQDRDELIVDLEYRLTLVEFGIV